ncbi:hypothetical protein ALC56_07119 [Trachymyrmex septentrionalis]|uniref:Uncharacterized protein n=1 Tax=Trachymyrmex septentrionalis TaxID=34720 RepID=A0A151JW88_9HYME|nr:hypothetical protein ALC56_07119 [Trachymyrmex septentrionalis]
MCLHELSLVDDTMETIGSPKKYRHLRKWIIRITIGCILYMFYYFARPVYFFIYVRNMRLLVFSILKFCFPLFVYILSALIWEIIVGCVSFRFHQANDRLHVIYSELFENNTDYGRQNRSNLVCQRIAEAENRNVRVYNGL